MTSDVVWNSRKETEVEGAVESSSVWSKEDGRSDNKSDRVAIGRTQSEEDRNTRKKSEDVQLWRQKLSVVGSSSRFRKNIEVEIN
jgi:hypothetical protein